MKGAFPALSNSLLLCRLAETVLPLGFIYFFSVRGLPLTPSLGANQSFCFAGLDLRQQSTTSVLAALHRVVIIVRLVLTGKGGLCPLRRQRTEDAAEPRDEPCSDEAPFPPVIDGGQLGCFPRPGEIALLSMKSLSAERTLPGSERRNADDK